MGTTPGSNIWYRMNLQQTHRNLMQSGMQAPAASGEACAASSFQFGIDVSGLVSLHRILSVRINVLFLLILIIDLIIIG